MAPNVWDALYITNRGSCCIYNEVHSVRYFTLASLTVWN
jgi:hypothetical protein